MFYIIIYLIYNIKIDEIMIIINNINICIIDIQLQSN